VFDTGNPIEPPPNPRPDKAAARKAWGFPESGDPVMLIYGGSQGAKAINETVAAWLGSKPANLYVIWATGQGTYDQFASLESERVKVKPYLSPIADAYAAADFALSRGGAMATAELCAWGIPPIVVPLPTAAADHQTANAKALSQAGAAEFIPQADLSAARLQAAIEPLIGNPGLLAQRSEAALRRARPDAAVTIATHILSMVGINRIRDKS
jgi:UDP-N-acetylglucosamine--N-acetylmuramyl-(pentapeptide) pyrophosphoryl-undecaprenol N-acetylglucosamine transferase